MTYLNIANTVSTDIAVPYLDWLKSKIFGVNAQNDIYKAPFIYKEDVSNELKGLFGQSMPADVLKTPMANNMMSYFLFSELNTHQIRYIRDYTLNNIDYSALSADTINDFEAIKAAPRNSFYLLDKIQATKDLIKIFQDTFDDYMANADVELLGQNSDDFAI